MKPSYKLPIFIALFHVPILFLTTGGNKKKELPRKKITINTIHLIEEPVYTPTPSPKIAKAEKKAPPKKKKAPTKKVAKKAPPKKKVKKKVSKKKIQKALNKSLTKSKNVPKSKKTKSKKIAKNDAGKAQSEYNKYLQRIFEILSDSLTLPEGGKVKLAITVGKDGKVVKIETLLTESSLNLAYLQENVSGLIFPKYAKKEDRTFTIVFSDEK